MSANSTGRAQAFLSASDAAISQEVPDGKGLRSEHPIYAHFYPSFV
jgi:hypothetical protein